MISLPKEFAVIEFELNREFKKLEDQIAAATKLDVLTSAEKLPFNKKERVLKLLIEKDGTHKGVIKSQGKNFTFDLTEVP